MMSKVQDPGLVRCRSPSFATILRRDAECITNSRRRPRANADAHTTPPRSFTSDTTSRREHRAAYGSQSKLCSAAKHHHNARTNKAQHDIFDMFVRTWSVSAPRDSKRMSSSDPLPVAEPPPQP